MRVLHVSGDAEVLQSTKMSLEDVDPEIQVVSVQSPEEALRLLSSEHWDCVVSDNLLPGIDGLELFRLIRERDDVPFILYTGRGSEETAEAAFAAGVDAYVRRSDDPTHRHDLADRLTRAVKTPRTLEMLRECEGMFRTLFTCMDEGVALNEVVIGEGGEPVDYLIREANPAFERFLGVSRGEAVGRRATALYGAGGAPHLDVYSRVAADGVPVRFETYYQPTDRSFEVSAFSLGGGRFATVFFDITERKRAMEEARRLAYRLNGVEPSGCYMSPDHGRCFKAYADLTHHGVPGLCVTREDPGRLVADYGVKKESVLLLSSRPVGGYATVSDLEDVSGAIASFLMEHGAPVVVLDGLEYLVSRHGFDAVYGFVQERWLDFLEAGAVLLMPVDLVALSGREGALLASAVRALG